jgi:hypothetical protein
MAGLPLHRYARLAGNDSDILAGAFTLTVTSSNILAEIPCLNDCFSVIFPHDSKTRLKFVPMLKLSNRGEKSLILLLLLGSLLIGGKDTASAATPIAACDTLAGMFHGAAPGPLFLPSYPTVKSGPLEGTAFLYDNAVATIALVACRKPKEAQQIGDAMLVALDRDRYWHDGRLRNGYLAGSIGPGPVKLTGWWDATQNQWVEDRYQVGSDNGNMAWAMLALLALDRTTHDRKYLEGAVRLGNWIEQWRSKIGPGGFVGGTFAHEPHPIPELWKSTEHNTDLSAAFSQLAQATGDTGWLRQMKAAERFVRAMWTPGCQCFAVGTGEDGLTHNPFVALDAQIWPLLALPGALRAYRPALETANSRMGVAGGFAYSEAKDGLWTEGTAQVALLMALSGREKRAEALFRVVDGMRAPDGSYFAANTKQLPTGFMLDTDPAQPRQYFHMAHLAALSWAAISAMRIDPFTGRAALP